MSDLLSIRTSTSSFSEVALASYSTAFANGWGGFVPGTGLWFLP